MRENTTKAAEVRRVLKGGRPRKIRNEALTPLDAVHRIVNEANRARVAMKDAGLNPDDIRCGLIYTTPEVPGKENMWEMMPLPTVERQVEFYSFFADLVKSEVAILFLGILWQQVDREANPNGVRVVIWLTPFLGGLDTPAEALLLAAKHHAEEVVKNGGRPLAN